MSLPRLTCPLSCLAPASVRIHLVGACLAALGHGAWAQSDASASVVVTGSVQGQRSLDAPYAITAVGGDDLRAAGPLINLSEALARVPGLVASNRNNYAQDLQISSRGFGARAAFGVRGLRLYADGIPATMPDGQGQVAHFDLASAQRIEVLRGPFSVLYGNSSGGVIAMFSEPVRERRVELGLDAGSSGLKQARLRVAAALAPGLDLQASLADMTLDGFRPQSEAHRSLGNARLAWVGDQDRVTMSLSSHEQSAQDPLGLTRAQFDADPMQTTAQAVQFDTRKAIAQTQGGLNWRHQFAGDSPLRETGLTLYQGARSVTQWQAIAPTVQTPVRHGGGVVDFDRDYRGVEGRSTWRLGTADVVVGLNFESQRDDRRGFENFVGTGATQVLGVTGKLRRDETNRATTREAFTQVEWPVADALSLTGGVRTGRVSMSTGDHFLSNGDDTGALAYRYTNPVIGLRWRLQSNWALHASAARGFESPTLGELAYRPDGKAGFNDALLGQASRQFEAGSKWRLAGLDIDATVYAVDTDHEIGVQTNSGGRSTFQNVGRTRRQGAELALQWKPAAAWRAQFSASWLAATYRDGFTTCAASPCTTPNVKVAAGNRIVGTQAASAWAEAAWQPGWLPGELALEWRAMGRTQANDTNTEQAGGYALAHLRWRTQWSMGSADTVELLARVDNLFDRVHVGSVIVNDGNGRYFEPGAPRSLLLSARWQHRW
ncbi:MAG: TonB-dependent receptor [Ideonella sp.]|nr:TonB-dependent receptor [Ideonella sp.]